MRASCRRSSPRKTAHRNYKVGIPTQPILRAIHISQHVTVVATFDQQCRPLLLEKKKKKKYEKNYDVQYEEKYAKGEKYNDKAYCYILVSV